MPWPGLHLDTTRMPGLTHLTPDSSGFQMTCLGEMSCGFVAFEFKKRERERKKSKKATTQDEMGFLLQKEESRQALERARLPSGLLNCSLPLPGIPSTPFWVLF